MKSGKTRSSKDRRGARPPRRLPSRRCVPGVEPEQLGRFLAATGIGPDQIRNAARDRSFLAGVLDHLPATSRCWSPSRSTPASIRPTSSAPAQRSAASGNGTAVMAALLPRLPRRRRRARARCPACGSPRAAPPRRTRRADHRACRLRRVLRHHREARRPVARRQAADHRRRQARRRLDRLLRRAHLRRALGDADVRGAAALPARHRRPPEHGEIRRASAARCAR